MTEDNLKHIFETERAFEDLTERRRYLQLLKKELIDSLRKAPNGKLHVITKGSKPEEVKQKESGKSKELAEKYNQFYVRTDTSQKTGRYLKKNETKLLEELAQKEYDEILLIQTQKEIEAIESFLNTLNSDNIEKSFLKIDERKRKYIKTRIYDEKSYVTRWMEDSYDKMGFSEDSPMFITNKNERVRSKSEVMIAGTLEKMEVPYKYEKPLSKDGTIWARPDFTILNVRRKKEYVWEHFGMMDDPNYLRKTLKKISAYLDHGYVIGENLIVSFESQGNPLNLMDVERMIKAYLI